MASPLSTVNKKSTLGFTLVEMVTVILILGILVVGVSSFIIFGTRIFVESSSVDQVLSQSRFAVERMTRELRSALPNSVRLNSDSLTYQCVEFVPIEASTTYLAMPIIPAAAASTGIVILDNTASAIRVNQFAWIYPLVDADVYSSARQKRAQIKTPPLTLANQVTLTFTAPTRFAEASPRQRIYFGSSPVSYCFEKGASGNDLQIVRYAGYNFNTVQPNPATMGTGVLMAQSVANVLNNGADLPLILTPSSLVNNAMVHLQPRFNVNGETFQYRHQVQVINVP
ncbi:type II secretion system GspH family protein [Shewanella sp. SM101]|jgi:MSHA biogenesis protein MshO|uniref:PilW family protein n=1 Tax=Shewanella TaxID=22 RepID=UPI0021DA4C34|nr:MULTISPECIES: type II secretion system protein [unclassified Shewanella]MCU7961922.1 type II secretion system GspH family protein [Shewanella sp. SW32]MCU7969854.1 type II secretion system GspH family protein [Shewanella sp. SW29]MCU7987049.1 type II secretion system GspH family protein [Shewanella sp. SW24]MCU7998782.1 type II secretion system GspH family protein [Shewanella sp. SM95]MCU8104352.1 type II secretion system GspH family protein [Shewanella sp. SM101]